MKKNRILWLDALKGVAIILVVLRHIMSSNIIDCNTVLPGNMIFAIQMPLFMTIAGYFGITRKDYYKSLKAVEGYIKKRFLRYMIPFFSWYFFVYVFLRGYFDRNIGKAFIILAFNVDAGLWFLYVVFALSSFMIIGKWLSSKIWKIKMGGVDDILLFCMSNTICVAYDRKKSKFSFPWN